MKIGDIVQVILKSDPDYAKVGTIVNYQPYNSQYPYVVEFEIPNRLHIETNLFNGLELWNVTNNGITLPVANPTPRTMSYKSGIVPSIILNTMPQWKIPTYAEITHGLGVDIAYIDESTNLCFHDWKSEQYFSAKVFTTCKKCGAKKEELEEAHNIDFDDVPF